MKDVDWLVLTSNCLECARIRVGLEDSFMYGGDSGLLVAIVYPEACVGYLKARLGVSDDVVPPFLLLKSGEVISGLGAVMDVLEQRGICK